MNLFYRFSPEFRRLREFILFLFVIFVSRIAIDSVFCKYKTIFQCMEWWIRRFCEVISSVCWSRMKVSHRIDSLLLFVCLLFFLHLAVDFRFHFFIFVSFRFLLLSTRNNQNIFSRRYLADSDRVNNNSLIAQIANLPGFDASKARFVQQYSTRASPEKSALEIVPTAAELMLPWRRDRQDMGYGTWSWLSCLLIQISIQSDNHFRISFNFFFLCTFHWFSFVLFVQHFICTSN